MTTIKCGGPECDAVFETTEAVSPNAQYRCRKHTNSNEDKVRFQKHQFEKDLSRAGTPISTGHIPHRVGTPQPSGFRPHTALKPGAED